ncbi:hypothetical protein F4778DRAFT_256815 [Xylariomycetidae sp. FL2044]|nr:hypothetical protein F4778DRAFT_256815 [Xylariomycetidae sp. FL2044]
MELNTSPPSNESIGGQPPSFDLPDCDLDGHTRGNIHTEEAKETAPSRIFPTQFTIYRKTGFTKPSACYLAASASAPLNYIDLGSGILRGSKSHVLLHAGPDARSPLLATAKPGRWGRDHLIELAGSSHRQSRAEKLVCKSFMRKTWYEFSIQRDNGKAEDRDGEMFEWRESTGSDIQGLGLRKRGWKLVRLGAQGVTEDNEEVVAVWAEHSRWRDAKPFEFRFLRSGASGILGDRWAVMAVVTALGIWYEED